MYLDCVFCAAVKLLVSSGRTRQFTINNVMNDFEKLILPFVGGPHDVKCGKGLPANNNGQCLLSRCYVQKTVFNIISTQCFLVGIRVRFSNDFACAAPQLVEYFIPKLFCK